MFLKVAPTAERRALAVGNMPAMLPRPNANLGTAVKGY
jgi:hypothetical protein